MTFEEMDERYHDAALTDDEGDGWDDPSEVEEDEDDDAPVAAPKDDPDA